MATTLKIAGIGLLFLFVEVVAAMLYLLLIVSGRLLNLELSFSPVLRTIHRVLPAVALAVNFVLFYGL